MSINTGRPSYIDVANNGDVEVIKREIETSTIRELRDRYDCSESTAWKWERFYGVSAARICFKCKTKRMSNEMRRTKSGAIAQLCIHCEPQRPGQAATKTSDRERTFQEYTDMPAVMYRYLRAKLTRRAAPDRPYYWQQGASV
jgi:hypothetical protein